MEIAYSPALDERHKCFEAILGSLKNELSSLKPISATFGKSKTIRQKMSRIVSDENSGWHKQIKVNPLIQDKKKKRNYFVEYIFDFHCLGCANKHRLFTEICFDNREAVPANLFKLDMGVRNFKTKSGSKALGLIICLGVSAREVGKWDNSVATSDEYELAIDTGYRDYLDANHFLILEIKS
jgi:hypothetical protein